MFGCARPAGFTPASSARSVHPGAPTVAKMPCPTASASSAPTELWSDFQLARSVPRRQRRATATWWRLVAVAGSGRHSNATWSVCWPTSVRSTSRWRPHAQTTGSSLSSAADASNSTTLRRQNYAHNWGGAMASTDLPLVPSGIKADVETQEAAEVAAASDVVVARMERLPFTRKHLKIAALLSTGTFFDAFDSLIIGSVLAVIVTSLGISIQAAGILVSAAFAGQLIGALAAGVLSEFLGRRLVLLGTMTIFGLMALVCAFATDLNQLYVARIVQGLGLGAEVPIAGALFNEFVRGKTRGLVVGLYENAFNLAVNIAPLIALLVYSLVGND